MTQLSERARHFRSGKGFAELAAYVCVTAALGLAWEAQTLADPPETLKLLSSFAMACAIALWLYSRTPNPTPSSGHQ